MPAYQIWYPVAFLSGRTNPAGGYWWPKIFSRTQLGLSLLIDLLLKGRNSSSHGKHLYKDVTYGGNKGFTRVVFSLALAAMRLHAPR